MNNNLVFLPKNDHIYTLILLHGMYETTESLIKLTYKLMKKYKKLKIILPNAPKRTINWSEEIEYGVSAWYNYFTRYDGQMKHDEIDNVHFDEQVKRINKLIDEEVKLLNGCADNIIIGGISQGGTLAFHIGLNYHKNLGGIIGIHTILMDNITQISSECQQIPIYLFSGNKDQIYNIKLQNRSLKILRRLKYRIFWHIEKDLKHSEYSKKENPFLIWAIKHIISNCACSRIETASLPLY